MKTSILDEVSTPDLIDELCRRHEACVFIGNRSEGTKDGRTTYFEWHGHSAYCYGLCHQMAFEIQKDVNDGTCS